MTPQRQLHIVVTGGGTGGHVGPALATIQAMRDLSAGQGGTPVFLYLGSANGIEKTLAQEAGLDFCSVQSGKLRRATHWRGLLSLKNLADVLRVPVGIAQSLRALQRFRPDALLATGGYVSVPPVLAAFILRVPILIHEQTVQVGLANKISALAATRIALSFADAARYLPARARAKAWETGNPVREIVFAGDKQRAVERFGFLPADNTLPCVYVTGGAQGARAVNSALLAILPDVLTRCRVLHQCGPAEADRFAAFAQTLPSPLQQRYWTAGFVGDEIGDVFALADLVVGRSGAGTVTEAAALGLPALLIPLVPTGGDEQTKNARRMADAGGAILLPAHELTPARLLREWNTLLADPARRQEMGKSARSLARPEAARDLARAVLALAGASLAADAPAL